MSGSSDTSQPADRAAFNSMVQGGTGGGAAVANAVANCTLSMPLLTSSLLQLPDGSTYAAGAAPSFFSVSVGLLMPAVSDASSKPRCGAMKCATA